jgi:hypothetical protein
MGAVEWERASGRTFTADILPILNCVHISLYPNTFNFCVKSLYTQLYTVCPSRTCNTLLVQYHHILYNIDTIYHLNCRSIQHTLICLFIIIEDVTQPSPYTGLQMQIF